jgi:hypothetical protein
MLEKIRAAALLLAALPTWGATTYYTNPALFSSGLTAAGFTPAGPFNFAGATSGTTIFNVGGSGVNFSGILGNSPATLNVSGTTAQIVVTTGNSNDRVVITPPANVYALGIEMTNLIVPSTWCFGLAGGDCAVSQAVGVNQSVFFGVINQPADGPLPALQLYASGTTQLSIQSFRTGTLSVAEAPEPSSLALVGGALIALPLLARHWRRRSTLFF